MAQDDHALNAAIVAHNMAMAGDAPDTPRHPDAVERQRMHLRGEIPDKPDAEVRAALGNNASAEAVIAQLRRQRRSIRRRLRKVR